MELSKAQCSSFGVISFGLPRSAKKMALHRLEVQEGLGLSAVSGIIPTSTWCGDVYKYLEW